MFVCKCVCACIYIYTYIYILMVLCLFYSIIHWWFLTEKKVEIKSALKNMIAMAHWKYIYDYKTFPDESNFNKKYIRNWYIICKMSKSSLQKQYHWSTSYVEKIFLFQDNSQTRKFLVLSKNGSFSVSSKDRKSKYLNVNEVVLCNS